MKLSEQGALLRIFVGEADKHQGKPLYQHIVLNAREIGLAGATVTRGIMGYGAASRIQTSKLLRLSEDLPIVVEIVDTEANIERLLPFLDDVVDEGLVTIKKAQVLVYRHTNS